MPKKVELAFQVDQSTSLSTYFLIDSLMIQPTNTINIAKRKYLTVIVLFNQFYLWKIMQHTISIALTR